MRRFLFKLSLCAMCAGTLLASGCAASQGARYAHHLETTLAESPNRDAGIASAFGLDEFAPTAHAAARRTSATRVTAVAGP